MSQLMEWIQGSNVLQFETTLDMRHERCFVEQEQSGEEEPSRAMKRGALALDSERVSSHLNPAFRSLLFFFAQM